MASVIERYANSQLLARAAAEHFIRIANDAIKLRGRFAVALSGGATPKTLYEQLAAAEMVSRVKWRRVYVFWGDERCVPPGHADSNYRLAYESLLLHAPIPPENVHRIHGELPPEQAAREYERQLGDFFSLVQKAIPRFDLVLLGLGLNGHIASLFPDAPALHEKTRLVTEQYVEELQSWRVTVTPQVINHAANVTFLVSGQEKAEVVRAVLDGPAQPDRYPAQLIKLVAGKLRWLVDEDAAALLSK
jgi:6-phosphogluconolactonase